MKNLFSKIGTLGFYLLWPFMFFYLRLGGTRSRVLVVHEDEVLLLQGWLSRKEYHLPGGGAKRHESAATAAARELEEETGITIMQNSLKRIGLYRHNSLGLSYNAQIFSVELSSKPELRLHGIEIINAQWINFNNLKKYTLGQDVQYALKRYRPVEQARLL